MVFDWNNAMRTNNQTTVVYSWHGGGAKSFAVFAHECFAFVFDTQISEEKREKITSVILNALTNCRFRQYNANYLFTEFVSIICFLATFVLFLIDIKTTGVNLFDFSNLGEVSFYYALLLLIVFDGYMLYLLTHNIIWFIKRHQPFLELFIFFGYTLLLSLYYTKFEGNDYAFIALTAIRFLMFLLEMGIDYYIDVQLAKHLQTNTEAQKLGYVGYIYYWTALDINAIASTMVITQLADETTPLHISITSDTMEDFDLEVNNSSSTIKATRCDSCCLCTAIVPLFVSLLFAWVFMIFCTPIQKFFCFLTSKRTNEDRIICCYPDQWRV